MKKKMRYTIAYLTLSGKTFTYSVKEYKIIPGDFIEFTDEKTNQVKRLHSSRCEISEVDNG
jgi:hypothetical protein